MLFNGSLSIRTINGRFGNFNVGLLTTELGEFTVKDSLIEEYEPGRYEGKFEVTSIYPKSYFTSGRLIVENRARVISIILANAEEAGEAQPASPVDVDPVEEEAKSAPEAVVKTVEAVAIETAAAGTAMAEPPSSAASVAAANDTAAGSEHAYGDLFGPLWPLTDEVKLDPTVDRTRFRSQRDALKKLGYQFQPLGQVWLRAA